MSASLDIGDDTEHNDLSSSGIVPLNIVLFAPSPDSKLGKDATKTNKDAGALLAAAINGTREMYVTGTKWMGRAAVRLAVSNWRTNLASGGGEGGQGDTDLEVVKQVLDIVAR